MQIFNRYYDLCTYMLLQSLIIAFVVGCLAYCNGQDSTCVTSPPREAVIDGQTDVQSTEIQ